MDRLDFEFFLLKMSTKFLWSNRLFKRKLDFAGAGIRSEVLVSLNEIFKLFFSEVISVESCVLVDCLEVQTEEGFLS